MWGPPDTNHLPKQPCRTSAQPLSVASPDDIGQPSRTMCTNTPEKLPRNIIRNGKKEPKVPKRTQNAPDVNLIELLLMC